MFVVFLLLTIGVTMLYSTSGVFAEQQYGDALFFVKRQLAWILAGGVLMALAAGFNYSQYRPLSWYLLLIGLVLLVAVFVPGVGKTVGGARRWIAFNGFAFQPSEAVKLILVVFFADLMVRFSENGETGLIKTYVFPLSVLGFVLGLIFAEPDFGMTMLVGTTVMIIFFAGGVKLRYLFVTLLASLPLAHFAVFRSAYRRKRILAFLNPWDDPRGIGFQIIQSFVALGSGGLFGVGLGQSQQKLFYLPEAHTDFIFSIIGEELGFVGCAGVILLFASLVIVCVLLAMKIPDKFGRLLIVGIISMIGMQAALNIAVVSGSMPTKGLPLPFISFGGSNLVVNMIGMGIILNVARINLKAIEKNRIFKAKKRNFMRF